MISGSGRSTTLDYSSDPDATGDYVLVGPKVGIGFRSGRDFGMLDQVPYGNFRPGRFAWLLADVGALAIPAPTKGRRGLWEWDEAPTVTGD